MSGEVFYGQTDGRTAEKKRRKNFVLGWPKLWAEFFMERFKGGLPMRCGLFLFWLFKGRF